MVTTSRLFWWNEIKDLMTRMKMHISKEKWPFYPLGEVKCGLQNEVSTHGFLILKSVSLFLISVLYRGSARLLLCSSVFGNPKP